MNDTLVIIVASLLLLFASSAQAQDADVNGLVALLGSDSQEVRDDAAKQLREAFVPPGREKWDELLKQTKLGESKAAMMQRFGVDPGKLERGIGTGPRHMESYRLDDHWVLSAWFRNADDTLEHPCEVKEQMRGVWVAPPEGFSGEWLTYFVNGRVQNRIEYVDGKYHGTYTSYHATGGPSVVQHYSHHKADGEDTGYFPTGEVMYRGRYAAGNQVGVWTWFEQDSSIRSQDNRGSRNAIIEAIQHGDFDQVRKLLKELKPEDVGGAKYQVLWSPNARIVGLLNTQWKLDIPPVKLAVINGRLTQVQKLAGTFNAQQLDNLELLKLAALHGHVDIIAELVAHGANINDNVGQNTSTPLATAAEHGHLEAAEKLIELGADVNFKADYTALQRACIGDQPDAVALLLKHGADVNAARHDKQSALHFAAKNGSAKCVRLLLDASADAAATNSSGDTGAG